MRGAARCLLGEHDFASFGSPMRKEGSTVRFLKRCDIRLRSPFLVFIVEANAFLRLMVRNMVGALLKVGSGRICQEELIRLVDSPVSGSLTPISPQGLFLWRVFY
jgi:tRNA pseudouridine38-40 synthase